MGLELCNPEDPYEGIRCPGTDEQDDLCASWDEICDGTQKCGVRKRALCISAVMADSGFNRDRAEDEDQCNGEESSDCCAIKLQEPPRCGEDFELINDEYVVVTSPEYPRYPADMYCFWRVKAPQNSKITIELLDFDSETNYDYINLGLGHKCDPAERDNYAIYKHSGETLPQPSLFTVQTNEIFVTFSSDSYTHGRGFKIRTSIANNGSAVYSLPPPRDLNTTCGEEIRIDRNGRRIVVSPHYPKKYDNLFQCDWIIVAKKGRRIGLYFQDFVTELGADFLSIGTGNKPGRRIVTTLSGNRIPENVIPLNMSKGWIRFTTDDSNRRKGFKIVVIDYPINECGGEYAVPRGGSVAVASPLFPFRAYRLNQECLWIFTISKGRKLSVNITDFSIHPSDIFSAGTGPRPSFDWSNYIIREVNGDSLPKPKRFNANKNSVWFYFRSDGANVAQGFKADIFDNTVYKAKKRPKRGKTIQPNRGCGGEITREDIVGKIVIQSPGYPNRYESLMECFWILDIPFGGEIRIRFQYFNTEKHLDLLSFGNGTNPNKKKSIAMTYSGSETPEPYAGVFQLMWIRFNTDLKHSYPGWSLVIEPRPYNKCGGELVVPVDGSLSLGSPAYPEQYPPNLVCRYIIRGAVHHRLTVSIAEFETEPEYDTLTVSEGCPITAGDATNSVLYQYSGLGLPVNYQSLPRANSIWVEFRSNHRIGYHGFLLNFADTPLKAQSNEGVGCPSYNRTEAAAFVSETFIEV